MLGTFKIINTDQKSRSVLIVTPSFGYENWRKIPQRKNAEKIASGRPISRFTREKNWTTLFSRNSSRDLIAIKIQLQTIRYTDQAANIHHKLERSASGTESKETKAAAPLTKTLASFEK